MTDANASLYHAQSMLSQAIGRATRDALYTHRVYVETLAEQSIRNGAVVGFCEIEGEGESIIQIPFPLQFIEKPIFTAGLELPANISFKWGEFPFWSATVGSWVTAPAENEPLYVGATVGALVLGPPRSILHYRFEAQSFTNPTTTSITMGTIL